MKNTILTIEHNNYQENVIVNAKNVKEVRNLIKEAKGFTVAFQGDYIFSLVEDTEKSIEVECCSYYRDGSTKTNTNETVIVHKDGKVKFDGDCMGSYIFRFQKVKSTSFGDYINVYGERMYFAWGAPKFK